jgi:hypothetical protein
LGPRLLKVQCKHARKRGDVIAVTCAGSWYSPERAT